MENIQRLFHTSGDSSKHKYLKYWSGKLHTALMFA